MSNLRPTTDVSLPYVVLPWGGAGGAELRGRVVHLFAPRSALGAASLSLTLRGAVSVLWTPQSAPTSLGPWSRRIHRVLLASQDEARAWTAFVPLGRLVVVEQGAGAGTEWLRAAAESAVAGGASPGAEALRVVYAEAWSTAHRRRGGPPVS